MRGEPTGPAHANRSIRVVIVDDHPLYRYALKSMLGGQPDLEVVAEAADGAEAVELCRRLEPELVLMDMRMPKMDGITATRAIKGEFSQTVVLVLSAIGDPESLAEALRAGAGGYILKFAGPEEVIGAIREVLAGEASLDREVATRLLLRLMKEAPELKKRDDELAGASVEVARPASRDDATLLESLSEREVEVLGLMARGRSNQQISQELLVSTSTVKKHVRHIILKLGVSDRVQAAVKATQLGLLAEEEPAGE